MLTMVNVLKLNNIKHLSAETLFFAPIKYCDRDDDLSRILDYDNFLMDHLFENLSLY